MATVTDRQAAAALGAYDETLAVRRGVPHLPRRLDAMRAALEAAEHQRLLEQAEAAHGDPHVIGEAVVTRGGKACQARRCGDEMLCGRCGLAWSPGDEDPPKCSPSERRVSVDRRQP